MRPCDAPHVEGFDLTELRAVGHALARARRLHPEPTGRLDALRLELAELEQAYEHGGTSGIVSEALDVAVCALRIAFEGDPGPNQPSIHSLLVHEIEKLKTKVEDLEGMILEAGERE